MSDTSPATSDGPRETTDPSTKLVVLWTSGDREVALNMAWMYAENSLLKGWWQDVVLLIWGPASRLLSEDGELQLRLGALREAGVELLACKACADRYGVAGRLEALGVRVMYTGAYLTEALQAGVKVLSV